MNNKKGFSLLSFLVYLVCLSMISLCMCQVITSLIIPSLAATRKCKSLMTLHIATDLFVRDIRTMRNMPYMWKLVTSQELIWHVADHDICWRFVEDRLERIEGLYNNGWKSKKASVIAVGIFDGYFKTKKHKNRICGIKMTIMPKIKDNKPIICYVSAVQGNRL